jgi:hypothetical protein
MKPLFILMLLFVSPTPEKAFEALSALQGTWKMESAKGPIYEEWNNVNDQLIQGRSYKLKGAHTMIMEQIQLKKMMQACIISR